MSIAALEPIYKQIPDSPITGNSGSKDDLGMDTFLTMLVAQLKNQDPLNPLEGTDFTAQLAQFTNLDQQFEINDNLADIRAALSAQENGSVIDYIGKVVKTNDDTVTVIDGQAESSTYTLGERANVAIYIYDEHGLEVRRVHPGWQDAGEHELDWDGRDNTGKEVADGTYAFQLEAIDEVGRLVPYDSYVSGEITGVTYESGLPYLMIGDKLITPEEIVQVTNN